MFTEVQKIWFVKEMTASRFPLAVQIHFFKKFALKGRKKT